MIRRVNDRQAGLTLIEMLIALALFALISLAGLALVNAILGVERRTSGRLTRMADIERTAHLISADLDQIAIGQLLGDASHIAFRRHAATPEGMIGARYSIDGATLVRTIGTQPQRLLTGIEKAQWHYLDPKSGWQDHWPPAPDRAAERPTAVMIDLRLARDGQNAAGLFRRIIALPSQP